MCRGRVIEEGGLAGSISSFKPFIITCFDNASMSSSSLSPLEEEEEGGREKSLKYMWWGLCLKRMPFSLVKPKVSSPCISIFFSFFLLLGCCKHHKQAAGSRQGVSEREKREKERNLL